MRKMRSLKPLFVDTWNRHRGALIVCAAVIAALTGCLLLLLCQPADPVRARASEGSGVDVPADLSRAIPGSEPLADAALQQTADENAEMARRMEEIYAYLVQLDTMVTDNQSTLEAVRLQGDADLQEGENVSAVQEKLQGDVVTLGERMGNLREEIANTKELILLLKQTTADGQTAAREQTASTFTQIEESIRSIGREFGGSIDDVEKLIDAFRDDDASRHQTVITSLSEMKRTMENSQRESFDAVEGKLEELRESNRTLFGDLKQDVESGFDTLSGRMDGHDSRLEGMTAELNGNSAKLNGLSASIEEQGRGIADLTGRLQTGNGEILEKLGEYHQSVLDSFTSVSNGKQAVTAALLTKNIPVTGTQGVLRSFSELAGAISGIPSTADNTISWQVDEFAGGNDTASMSAGSSASVRDDGYAMQLGIGQQVVLPAGYYDQAAVVKNAVRMNGTLTAARFLTGDESAADGWWEGVDRAIREAYDLGRTEAALGAFDNIVFTVEHRHAPACFYQPTTINSWCSGHSDDRTSCGAASCTACGYSFSRWYDDDTCSAAVSNNCAAGAAALAYGQVASSHVVMINGEMYCPRGETANCGREEGTREETDVSRLGAGDRVISAQISYN
ncbi:MAG: hypothetical protein K6G16_08490 [Lachnospiraceae bacterium]|nr:hypothetical protein [Lachnospiraceae bacterium]